MPELVKASLVQVRLVAMLASIWLVVTVPKDIKAFPVYSIMTST